MYLNFSTKIIFGVLWLFIIGKSYAFPHVTAETHQGTYSTLYDESSRSFPQHIFSPMRYHRTNAQKRHHKAKRRHNLHRMSVPRRCNDFAVKTNPNCLQTSSNPSNSMLPGFAEASNFNVGNSLASVGSNMNNGGNIDNSFTGVTGGSSTCCSTGSQELGTSVNTDMGNGGIGNSLNGGTSNGMSNGIGNLIGNSGAGNSMNIGCDDVLVRVDPSCQGNTVSGATLTNGRGGNRGNNFGNNEIGSNGIDGNILGNNMVGSNGIGGNGGNGIGISGVECGSNGGIGGNGLGCGSNGRGSNGRNGHHVQLTSNQYHHGKAVHLNLPGKQMVQPGRHIYDKVPIRHYKANFAPSFQEKGISQIMTPSNNVYPNNQQHLFQQGQSLTDCADSKVSDVNDGCETPSFTGANGGNILAKPTQMVVTAAQNNMNGINQEIQAMNINQGFGTSTGTMEGKGDNEGDFPIVLPGSGQQVSSGRISGMQSCNFSPCSPSAYTGDRYAQMSGNNFEDGQKVSSYSRNLALPRNPFLRRFIPRLLDNLFQNPERRHTVKHNNKKHNRNHHKKHTKHAKHTKHVKHGKSKSQ